MVDEARIAEAELIAEKPYDASDPEQVNNARKKSGRRKKENLDFIRAMMTIPDGRKWAYEQLVKCNVFSTPFMHGSTDGTAFNCGMQNWGLQFLADITTSAPDKYVDMLKENK